MPYEAQHAAKVSPRMRGSLEEIVGTDDDEMTLDDIDQIFSVGLPVAVVGMVHLLQRQDNLGHHSSDCGTNHMVSLLAALGIVT